MLVQYIHCIALCQEKLQFCKEGMFCGIAKCPWQKLPGEMGIPLYKFNIGRYAVKKTFTVYALTLFLFHIFQLIRSGPDREPELGNLLLKKTHTKTIAGMNELTLFSVLSSWSLEWQWSPEPPRNASVFDNGIPPFPSAYFTPVCIAPILKKYASISSLG